MDLTNVKEIAEYTSLDFDRLDVHVNKLLKEGWFLLSCTTEMGLDDTQYTRIILGKTN